MNNINLMDEESLISALSNGDEQVFESIFSTLYPGLCGYVYNYIADTNVAQDIVQDGFIALWKNRNGFESYIGMKAFLYKTCRNHTIDYIRHKKSKENYNATLCENSDSFLDTIMINELTMLLEELIEQLPTESRKILRLTMDGKSYKEIALMLHISVNTVRNQRVTALKTLKKRSKILYMMFLSLY